MTRVVFITGASSGIGQATAKRFAAEGWNVAATMRNPEDGADLAALEGTAVFRCDVTDSDSIADAVSSALDRFGAIDVLVNNAGYGCYGPLEATPRKKMVQQFDTNVVGLLETTKAVLPHFRARKQGKIINISSMGGRVAGPLATLYYGSKFAVEGISESLCFEMAAIGVTVKVVAPGFVASDFNSRSIDISNDPLMSEYQEVVQAMIAHRASGETYRSDCDRPASVIYEAATDGLSKFRYASGDDCEDAMAELERRGGEALLRDRLAAYGLKFPTD